MRSPRRRSRWSGTTSTQVPPRAYLALKDPSTAAFASAIRVSGDGEAFEPAVAALPDRRFAVAGAEDARILARLATSAGLGPPVELGPKGVQVSLDGSGWDLVAVGADRQTGVGRIMTATLGRDGALVVAWTDEHEGQGDILLSWYADGTWSEDLPPPGASGPEEPGHPSIALDDAGNLHAAWVTREVKGGPTRIRYRVGRRADRSPSNAFRP